MHSHAYDSSFEPHDLRGKNILVVGVGNADIASEVSQTDCGEMFCVGATRCLGATKIFKRRTGRQSCYACLGAIAIARWLGQRVVSRAIGIWKIMAPARITKC